MRLSGVVICCIALLLMAGSCSGPDNSRDGAASDDNTPDLSKHPIYSKYEFSDDPMVIDIGVQPLWLPTSIISEAMKRDKILREELAKDGYEIRFHSFLKGSDVNFFLKAGLLEAGIGGDMPALMAAAETGAVITTMMQQGFVSIIATRHMTMEDLKGMRIGYPFGSNAHYALLVALNTAGLNETDVSLIRLEVNEMEKSLADGEIDAFSAWEPTPSVSLAGNDNFVVIHKSLSTGYLYFAPDVVRESRETVSQIIAAVMRVFNWVQYHHENLAKGCEWAISAAEEFSSEEFRLTVGQVVEMSTHDLLGPFKGALLPENFPDDRLEREFKFLKELGKMPESSDWEGVSSLFDRSYGKDVLAREDAYRLSEYNYEF